MLEQKQLNSTLANWYDIFQDFDFTISHCPGIDHIIPDALSRLFTDGTTDFTSQAITSIPLQTTPTAAETLLPQVSLLKAVNEEWQLQPAIFAQLSSHWGVHTHVGI
jgi:hypothetical protein